MARWTVGPRGNASTGPPDRRPLYLRPRELGRRVVALVLGVLARAYGAAAAVSVALSDADTVAGKAHDGLLAVPNLAERYEQARYLVEHRDRIQAAVDYARDHAPDPAQLDAAVRRSTETVDRLRTTYSEVTRAKETFVGIRPTNVLDTVPELKRHVEAAWAATPSLESIEDLGERAREAEALVTRLDLQDPRVREVYADLRRVMDNFGSDEIVATVLLMVLAVALGFAVGVALGFWGRRGRPGFVARTLQTWGVVRFGPWYAQNLEFAMSRPLYAAARERVQRDLVADPRGTLDAEAFDALERWFRDEHDGPGGRAGL